MWAQIEHRVYHTIIKYEIWEAFGGIDLQAYEQTADMKIINHISSDEEEVDVVVIEVIIINSQ